MSSYIREISNWPDKELCPYHGTRFRKKGKFWHCPFYGECGHSIGQRRLGGETTRMWIQQTRRGRAYVRAQREQIEARTLAEALALLKSFPDTATLYLMDHAQPGATAVTLGAIRAALTPPPPETTP